MARGIRLGADAFELEARRQPAPLSASFPGLAERVGLDPGATEDTFLANADGTLVLHGLAGVGDPNLYLFPFVGGDHLPTDPRGVVGVYPLDGASGTMGWTLSAVQLPDRSWAAVAAPRAGGGPRLQVVGLTPAGEPHPFMSVFVAEPSFRGGVEPGAINEIDTDGDGRKEIAVFVDGGGRTVQRTFDPATGGQVSSAYVGNEERHRPLPAGYGRFAAGPDYRRVGFLLYRDANGNYREDPEEIPSTHWVYLDNWEIGA